MGYRQGTLLRTSFVLILRLPSFGHVLLHKSADVLSKLIWLSPLCRNFDLVGVMKCLEKFFAPIPLEKNASENNTS